MAANWQEALRQALSTLSAPVAFALPAESEFWVSAPGEPLEKDGQLILRLDQPPLALSCDVAQPGGADLLRMAASLARALSQEANVEDDAESAYLRLLSGPMDSAELQALTARHHLPEVLPRCVLLCARSKQENLSWHTLRELVPVQGHDVLLEVSRDELAIIKDLSDGEGAEDVLQYAEALQETLSDETGHSFTLGIGTVTDQLSELARSLREARRALELGRIFQPDQQIYEYSRLLLERLLTHLPPEISQRYQETLFHAQRAKLLDAELLATVDAFFHKDLNLSDTARQLYIHRNTLVYRLDKIQRLTGLDLRSFDDAVTFKVLLTLRQYAEATQEKQTNHGQQG